MKWFKMATRQYSIQADLIRSAWMCHNDYYSVKNYLLIPLKEGVGDIYVGEYDWNKLTRVLAKEFYRDPHFLSKHLKDYKIYKKQLLKRAWIFTKHLRRYSAKSLFLFYKKLFDELHRYLFFGYFPWALDLEIDSLFKKLLKKKFKKDWEVIYNAIAAPTKYNEITLQLIKLLKMVINGTLNRDLGKHIKQYQWLPFYNFIGSPWTKKDFLKQLKGIKNPQEELTRLKTLLKKSRQNFKLVIEKLKRDKKLLNMAKLINEYAWLRTDRIDVVRKVFFYGQGFYRELERRIGFKNKESIWMTKDEIKEFLLNGKLNEKEIKKRAKNGCVFYIKNGKQKLISEPKEMKKIIKKELGISKKLPKILKGVVACKGVARGSVKTINSTKDISKMKKGNIFVASMTLQEYMLAIRKAAAIITDEGGITCHAAIISRELRIPCIIGTKIATKVLKDGDLVEVDADKGIVKIFPPKADQPRAEKKRKT